jgi:hypothetical protein
VKIFNSACAVLLQSKTVVERLPRMKYNMVSYFTIRNKDITDILDNTDEVMVDSGAHSFQKGVKVDYESYTREYAAWIQRIDRPNIVAYFEMDVDNMIGYERVLELRKILTDVSDKIVPVWHKNRGIKEYVKMCEEYSGKIVSIPTLKSLGEMKEEQYGVFLRKAWEHGCKLHALGMTRKKVLDTIPFDYVDSSSWMQFLRYGKMDEGRVNKMNATERYDAIVYAYKKSMVRQRFYENKWDRYGTKS